MPIRLAPDVLDRTFEIFRKCGRGRAECVVYWVNVKEAAPVAEVVHPDHSSGRGGYSVESSWINEFFLRLRTEQKAVLAQVHTHPTSAWHSAVDDLYSLVPAAGFASLVIPNFAMGPVGLAGAALYLMQDDGAWAAQSPADWILR